MTLPKLARRNLTAIAALIVGAAIGSSGVVPLFAWEAAEPGAIAINPAERTLDANLWLQTSAEYRACCLQAFSTATEKLKAKVAASPKDDLPFAVVMDLDETVLDNSGFQSFLDRERDSYSSANWDNWEKNYADDTRLIPGAKEFINSAAAQNVSAVFITNRRVTNNAATIEALTHNGLCTDGIEARLFGKTDTSDKTTRRAEVATKYRVLLYVGDNLRDFSDDFATKRTEDEAAGAQAIATRAAAVDAARAHFGDDWIIIPNPVYGEWQNPLGKNPRAQLRKSAMVKSTEARK
ncbi:hypothetical protein BH09SUM1_BH09SUM1_26730 [soil metagenome]